MRVARLGMDLRTLAACALLVLPACDQEIVGPPPPHDAATDAMGPALSDGGVMPPGEQDELCYDEVDNDLNGAIDCDEVSCQADVACCVGSARGECCDPSGTTSTLFIGPECDGLASDCVTADPAPTFFGAATPLIEDGALVPNGGAGHGGVVLREIDPRANNVVFDATIEVPPMRCGAECVDGAGIALLDAIPQPGAPALVRFGVLVSGSRDEALVLLGDEPIARAPIAVGTSGYRIELDVGGGAAAFAGEIELARVSDLDLPSRAVLAIFGRTQNRGPDEDAIRVRSASVTTRSCDAPAALARSSTPVLPWSGTSWDPHEVRRPSVVTYEDGGGPRALMAYAHDGQIRLAGRTDFGEFRGGSGDPSPPALALPAEIVEARDPWLLVHQARFILFFTGLDAEGRSAVFKASGHADHTQSFGAPAEVLDPAAHGYDAIDGASVRIDGATWTMVARVHLGGEHRIVRFQSTDEGLTWAAAGAPLRTPRRDDLFAFDRDEIASPALVSHVDERGRPIERLYYAGRRGTAWRIGLLVSSDGHHWRAVGPILGPSEGGFDALGVMDPAPIVEGGQIRLYYAGTDGTRFRIGVAGPAGTVGE